MNVLTGNSKLETRNHPCAFFDVDCRDLDPTGARLQFRPRVIEPLSEKLNALYKESTSMNIPLVFTTCCSGKMLQAGQMSGVLYIPCDAQKTEWQSHVKSHRLFYLQKHACGEPKANFACQAYDVFKYNHNAVSLVRMLQVDQWIVFGNGFDLCVNSTVRGLLNAGQRVHLLTDVLVPSARGYGDCGTEENRLRILHELGELGVTMGSVEEISNFKFQISNRVVEGSAA